MKRLLILILAALLLCGCTVQPGSETAGVPESTGFAADPTEPSGSYISGSGMETMSNGALRCYEPELAFCYGIAVQGEDVLVFSGEETTTLTRLSGENLYITASADLDCYVSPEDPSFQAGENGITYYNSVTREVVFLDYDLQEANRIAAPENMTGNPILSGDRLRLYYCTAEAIRVLDLETGLDRMIKSVAYPAQVVSDLLMGDTVLCCAVTDEHGAESTLFLSVTTGETLRSPAQQMTISTGEKLYCAVSKQGEMNVLLFGTTHEDVQMLIPEDPFADAHFLPESKLLVTLQTTETGINADCYDLTTGTRTASVDFPGNVELKVVAAGGNGGYIYFLGRDLDGDRDVICRWDPDASSVEDPAFYSGPYYTLEEPDEAGLDECRSYAASIGEKYGMEILVGPEAVSVQPWDYSFVAEHHVPVIMRELKKLETFLSHFPEGFFDEIFGQEKLCLVRSIRGTAQSGSLEAANGLQFWEDDTAYVVLAAGDSLEHAFYHEIFHLIDNKVLSACNAYYYWRNLNPEGFKYDGSFDVYRDRDGGEYLAEETRAFIDSYSMTYANEDRARIFEYACTPGNEHYFQTEIMQNKLKTLCQGIRTAFGLKKYTGELIWEQYLAEPLTP